MAKKILVVTKDIAEFQIYRPVVALLRKTGRYITTVVAEGLSVREWQTAGENLYSPGVSEASPFMTIEKLQPDIILTGLGAPINLGEKFGLAANAAGIPLGYVEDVWGVHRRSSAIPDFICTLDNFGKALVTTYNGRTIHVHITGSPAMDRLVSVEPDPEVAVAAAEHDLTVLLVGQDESTTPVIAGLVGALNKSRLYDRKVLLVPRLHQKFPQYEQQWRGSLVKAGCCVLWPSTKVSTLQLILSAGITVSIYSNALIEAAILGSLPVSWVSDVGREKMRANLGGLERFPLVDLGCAIEVSMLGEFLAISRQRRDQVRKRCREVFPNDGGNTERVVAAIEQELALR